MKKLMLLIGVLLFVSQVKAQHIETDFSWGTARTSPYYEIPEMWLDGDSIRVSFTIHFPESGITFDSNNLYATVVIGPGAPTIDLHWLNGTLPRDTTITYYGAKHVDDILLSTGGPTYRDLDYQLELQSLNEWDELFGNAGQYSFAYYPE